jgi:hypothetical protein
MKSPTRNQVIANKICESTQNEYGKVYSIVKDAWKTRSKTAHSVTDEQTHELNSKAKVLQGLLMQAAKSTVLNRFE